MRCGIDEPGSGREMPLDAYTDIPHSALRTGVVRLCGWMTSARSSTIS